MEYVTSMSNGAVDIFRGLAGLETGEEVKTDFEIHEPGALGLSLNGAGRVTVVDAGSPAEAHGIKLGDLVAALNDEAVLPGEAEAAVAGRTERPLKISVSRREGRDYDDPGLGVVKFRLDEECVKAERILEAALDSPASGPPPGVLRGAHGVAFVRCFETAIGTTSSRFGTGCVLARLPDGGWSAPSAIGVLGFGFGWQLGAQVMDFLIILNRPSAVLAFTAGVGVTLGASLGVSAGPYGAGSESRLELGAEGVAPAWTYACTKGIYAGVSLEGATLNERSAVNERHYMRPASCKDLLSGKIPPTPAAAKLHGLLKELDDKPAPAHWRVGAWHAEAPKDAPPDEAPAAPEETPARDPEAAAA